MGPPPLPHPVLVEVKIGFVGLGQIDTVNQTVWSRFFCDMYWNDPRLVRRACSFSVTRITQNSPLSSIGSLR